MDYINTLSKFGVKLEDRNQRTKFNKLKTRYRVLFEGFAAPLGGENVTMDMKSFSTPKGKFEDKTLISFYSTACVSGKLLFKSKCRIIFLYPLSEASFNEKCDYEDYFSAFSSLCDSVFIARSWDDVKRLCQD